MTASERTGALFATPSERPGCGCPYPSEVAAAIEAAEDAALERAAAVAEDEAINEPNNTHSLMYGGLAARIRALKAQQLPKKEG